jgi:hypothetical protein
MTENIPWTSASERQKAARKVLANFDGRTAALGPSVETLEERRLADALRALITPPITPTEDDLPRVYSAARAAANREFASLGVQGYGADAHEVALRAVFDAGIQSAHESREPADVPSQEFMLRHLGLDYRTSWDDEGEPSFYLTGQHIERQVD